MQLAQDKTNSRIRQKTGVLLLTLCMAIAPGCLKFQESALDSTSSGLIIPALFGASSATVSGLLRDRTGALVTGASLTFTSNALTSNSAAGSLFGTHTSPATISDTTDSTGRFSTTLTTGTHSLSFTFNSITYVMTFTVNSDGTSSAVSIDGSSYVSDSPVSAGSFIAVVVTNDGGCKAHRSTDLTGWTTVTLPSSLYACGIIRDVIFADGVFVAVGEDSGGGMPQCYIAVSPDGTNWTQKNCSGGLDTALHAVEFGNGTFVAVGQVNGGVPVIRIGNAQAGTWTTASTGTGNLFYSTLYFNGVSFFAAPLGGASTPVLYGSDNPASTNFSATDGVNCAVTANANPFHDIAGGPGLNFLTVAADGSNNGLMYSPFTNPVCTTTNAFFPATTMRSAAYDPYTGGWTAVGTGCLLDVSSDGLTWLGGAVLMSNGGECSPTVEFDQVIYSKTRRQYLAVGVQTTSLDPHIAVSASGAQDTWTFTKIVVATAGNNPTSIAIRE